MKQINQKRVTGLSDKSKRQLPLPAIKRALIVDDNEDTRFMMRVALELRGFRVSEADDSRKVMVMLEQEQPDIVFIDACLPSIDGFDITHRIKEIYMIPIIIISGNSTAEFQLKAHNAGCDECLCKPIDFDLMDKAINRLLFLSGH